MSASEIWPNSQVRIPSLKTKFKIKILHHQSAVIQKKNYPNSKNTPSGLKPTTENDRPVKETKLNMQMKKKREITHRSLLGQCHFHQNLQQTNHETSKNQKDGTKSRHDKQNKHTLV